MATKPTAAKPGTARERTRERQRQIQKFLFRLQEPPTPQRWERTTDGIHWEPCAPPVDPPPNEIDIVGAVDDQLRVGARHTTDADEFVLECSSEWHFARFTGDGATMASLVYSVAFHLAGKDGTLFVSVPNLARYLNAKEYPVRKAAELLVLSGFFQRSGASGDDDGGTRAYRPVPHSEWAKSHPGMCCHRFKMHGCDPDAALGRAMYAATDGRFKFYGNVLKGWRKLGFTDTELAEHCRAFWQADQRRHGFRTRFAAYLRTVKGQQ